MINMNHTRDKYQHIGVVRGMYYIGILAVTVVSQESNDGHWLG